MLSMLQAFFEESEIDRTSLFQGQEDLQRQSVDGDPFSTLSTLAPKPQERHRKQLRGHDSKDKGSHSFEYERHASLLKSKKLSAKEKPYLSKPSDKARQRFSISSAKLFFISLLSGESFINEK